MFKTDIIEKRAVKHTKTVSKKSIVWFGSDMLNGDVVNPKVNACM